MKKVVHELYVCSTGFCFITQNTYNFLQTIGTAGIFLACKIEETPRFLNDVVVVAYELIYKWDPSATKRIRQKVRYSAYVKVIDRYVYYKENTWMAERNILFVGSFQQTKGINLDWGEASIVNTCI